MNRSVPARPTPRFFAPASFALLVFVLLSTGAARLFASTWYVSPAGDDGAGGTISSPWRTVAHAMEIATAGDTIFLRAGEYREQVTTVRDGSADRPITLMGFPGESAIVDGTGADMRNGVIIANDNIQILDLTVRNWLDTGIWLQPNSDHLLVRRCVVHDCGAGIDIYEGVHDFVIDSVDIYGFAEESHGLDMTSHDGTPIYNGVISNCRSHDGGGGNCDGFALGHRGDGDVYSSFGDVHDMWLYNCVAYNVGDGFDISGEDNVLEACVGHDTYYGGNYKVWGRSATLVNCVGYNSGVNVELDHAIQHTPEEPAGTPPPNVLLVNCTFFNGTTYNVSLETDSCRLRMINCILAGGANVGMYFTQPFTTDTYRGDYNIFGSDNPSRMIADPIVDLSLQDIANGGWQQLARQDSHSLVLADPTQLFVDTNAAAIDLAPRPGSIAVDAGTSIIDVTPVVDIDGATRDARIDIGAYEFRGAGGTRGDGSQGLIRALGTDHVVIPIPGTSASDVQVVVTDDVGRTRVLRDVIIAHESVEISTRDFASGAYWLSVTAGSESRTVRVVIAW